jgi:hypothetical protein
MLSLLRIGIFAGVVLAVFAAVKTTYNAIKQDGYNQAVADINEAAQRDRIRASEKFILVAQKLENLQNAYNKQVLDLADAKRRIDELDGGLLDAQRDFDRRVATAKAESLRDFAKASRDNFARCRRLVKRFGFEAAEGSAAAHTLNATQSSGGN